MWGENALHCDVDLIFGTHRKEGDKFFNCVGRYHKGLITQIYDKSSLVFLTERVPNIPFLNRLFYQIFLKKTYPFSSGKSVNDVWNIEDEKVQVLICSEFLVPNIFFKKKANTIACFINDNWFSQKYITDLMLLYAKMFALENRCSIFYISHRYGCLIDCNGSVQKLLQ